MSKNFIALCVSAALAVTSGCALTNDAWIDHLANESYPIVDAPNGEVQLDSGVAEVELAEGSASKYRVQLLDRIAVGKLNDDSMDDAVVVLTTQSGGSGYFVYLAGSLHQEPQPIINATVLLGDRVIVRELRIEDKVVVVTFDDYAEGQAFSEAPSESKTLRYRLDNEGFHLL